MDDCTAGCRWPCGSSWRRVVAALRWDDWAVSWSWAMCTSTFPTCLVGLLSVSTSTPTWPTRSGHTGSSMSLNWAWSWKSISMMNSRTSTWCPSSFYSQLTSTWGVAPSTRGPSILFFLHNPLWQPVVSVRSHDDPSIITVLKVPPVY